MVCSWIDQENRTVDIPRMYAKQLDVQENTGNKKLSSNGKVRLETFAKWMFEQPQRTVIAGGHSLYFRYFFQLFLTKKTDNDLEKLATKKKIVNGGAVSCTLLKITTPDNKA